MSASNSTLVHGCLPLRPELSPGQSLESYLEHVADANHVTTAALLGVIRSRGASIAFLLHAPSAGTVRAVSELTGQAQSAIHGATLRRFDGLVHDLDGIDPDQLPPRRARSYRAAVAQGWVPARTSQMCPSCLGESRAWMLIWRLPGATVCPIHRCYLVATCPGCGLPFRAQKHSPLRAVGAASVCGNPLGQGPREQCRVALTGLATMAAEAGCLRRQERFDIAITGEQMNSSLGAFAAKDYLTTSRALTVMLLHLAGQPGAEAVAAWALGLTPEAEARTRERGPRWAITPPVDPWLRSKSLAAAEHILEARNLENAVERFRPWYELAPAAPDGVLGWLGDRTRMTPQLRRLALAAHAPQRRLSARLDAARASVPLFAIPQVIPVDLYRGHVAHLMGCGEETGRCFASLSLARGHGIVHTWEDAARQLGIPERYGPATVRAAHQRLHGSVEDLDNALHSVAGGLDRTTSWRMLEEGVRADVTRLDDWLPDWARTHQPRMKDTSAPYAITWRWIHEAGGLLNTSPAWKRPPTKSQRIAYRQFASAVFAHRWSLEDAVARQADVAGAVVSKVMEAL